MSTTRAPQWRSLAPLCLTLGALLCSLPASAASSAALVSAATVQTILLHHISPSRVIKIMRWDQANHLPSGVTQISSLPDSNSLSVTATPAGLAQVRQILRILDTASLPVQIKITLARATAADLKGTGINFDLTPLPAPTPLPGSEMGYAAGGAVAQLLQTLRKQGTTYQSPPSNVFSGMSVILIISDGQPIPALPELKAFSSAITPRINSDGSVTLALHPQATWRVAGKTNPDGTPATTTQGLATSRTVRSGDTLVFTNLFPGAAGVGDSQLLLFVTPTVVPVEDRSTPRK